MITDLNEINVDSPEGKLLLAALAVITTECRQDKTPDNVIAELNELSAEMFKDE